VAGVHTDSQSLVLEGLCEIQELVIVRQELRALTRRRLQKDRTGWCGRFHGLEEIYPHVLQSLLRVPGDRLPYMNHHALEANRLGIVQVLDQ